MTIGKSSLWAGGMALLLALTIAPSCSDSNNPSGRGQAPATAPGSGTHSPAAMRGWERIGNREDIRHLPEELQWRLFEVAGRPHTHLPSIAFAEADDPSQLFQYYLLDTIQFQPNVFTAVIPGINDGTKPTAANAANGQLPTVGAVRMVVEPKPGKPTDPNDVRTLVDMFTDISGLFVINNESGWYESWMIHDVRVPQVAEPHGDGRARYGTITAADAEMLRQMGGGNNVPGNFLTMDGNAPRFPAAGDRFPDVQSNLIRFPVSSGTYNAHQQSDVHAYWEFNPGTNWVFPHYELPFTGGIPGSFEMGVVGGEGISIIPGAGPAGMMPDPVASGDDPEDPRDPDRAEPSDPNDRDRPEPGNREHLERRNRFIPSGLTLEIVLDVFARPASFEPGVGMPQRLYHAYAKEVARVDKDGDGAISFQEADVEGSSDGMPNTRLYLPATVFNAFAVTREINDGLLAPRFAPGQRSYVLSGLLTSVDPAVPASIPRDADDR
jgi:hypothetical protein